MEAAVTHFPVLLMFATCTLRFPSTLKSVDFSLQSEEGAQQGDPLGPLNFCLVIRELLKTMKSEIVLAYLYDIPLADDADIVLKDLLLLEETGQRLGLEIKAISHIMTPLSCYLSASVASQFLWRYISVYLFELIDLPLTMSRYLRQVHRVSFWWELHCHPVSIWILCLKVSRKNCSCSRRDCS
jgi:hypothetical protein